MDAILSQVCVLIQCVDVMPIENHPFHVKIIRHSSHDLQYRSVLTLVLVIMTNTSRAISCLDKGEMYDIRILSTGRDNHGLKPRNILSEVQNSGFRQSISCESSNL
jgi:hypothetical protein